MLWSGRPKQSMKMSPASAVNTTTQTMRPQARPATGPSNPRTPNPSQYTGVNYGGNLGSNIPDDIADNQQTYRPGSGPTNAPGWGGGSVMGGTSTAAAQAGQYDQNGNWLGRYGTHVPGTNIDAGSRRLDNSAVNWGAAAGISNYLNMLPAAQQQQAATALRGMGLMPSYNGQGLDYWSMRQSMPGQMTVGGPAAWAAAGGGYMGNTDSLGNPLGSDGARFQGQQQADSYYAGVAPGRHAMQLRDRNAPGGMREAWGSIVNGRWVEDNLGPSGQGAQTFDPVSRSWSGGGAAGAGGGLAMNGMGGGLGGASSQGYPLQPGMQSAIQGILDNPSPFSAQQQSMLRNQATRGVEQQAQTAQQSAMEDAVRRGLNPAEAQANQLAIAGQYNNMRQQGLQNFELANAQATRQGLLGGVQAGLGYTGQQMQEEDSIRRYLALLGQMQNGQTPMFMQV